MVRPHGSLGCWDVGTEERWVVGDVLLYESVSYLFSIYNNIESHIENNIIKSSVYPILFIFYIFYIKNFYRL